MDCQTNCQDEEFETCEYELKADCMASCSGDGALFCDGEYVAASDLAACFNAIVELGIEAIDLTVDIDLDGDSEGDVNLDGDGFCSVDNTRGTRPFGWLGLVLGLAAIRRRAQTQ